MSTSEDEIEQTFLYEESNSENDDEDSMVDENACTVCLEPLEHNELPCQHQVHLACIARSGQNSCPLCRREVTFTGPLQELFERERQAVEEARRAREHNESLALVRQLVNEDRPSQMVRLHENGHMFRIRLVPSIAGPVDPMDLMLQVNQTQLNINNRVTSFDVDPCVFELFQLLRKVNHMSATTGLTVAQICSIVENNA